jgi:hypothetical protein
MPAAKQTSYLIHQRLAEISAADAVREKIELEVDRIVGPFGGFDTVNQKIEAEMDRLAPPNGILANVDTRLAEIKDAILQLQRNPETDFVGKFFLKALTPAGQICPVDEVGAIFQNAKFDCLTALHYAIGFKPSKDKQLHQQLKKCNDGTATPPLPTQAECKALLQALYNIFGDYAPGTPPINDGDSGQTTSAAE